MIDSATGDHIRQLVSDTHERGDVVHVYRIVRQLPSVNGYSLNDLTKQVEQEAIRIRANVVWDNHELGPSS